MRWRMKRLSGGWLRRAAAATVCGVLAVAAAGCAGGGGPKTVKKAPGAAPGGPAALSGAGATFPYPLYSKWIDVYGREKGVRINYQSIGSGAGQKQVFAGTVDFGGSDAPLNDEQLKEHPDIVHIPTALGAVVVTYNLPGNPELKLTPDLVADIFLGKIKKWNDPRLAAANPGVKLPDTSLTVVHRSDGSGTTFVFTDYLSAVSGEWKDKAGKGTAVKWPAGIGGKGNEGVSAAVRQTPGAVGYVELTYAEKNRMPHAAIRNREGEFVKASLDSVTAAAAGAASTMPDDLRVSIVNAPGKSSYPISSFTYILVRKDIADAAKGKALAEFLWWGIHDGQKYTKDLLYAPLPDEVVKKAEAKVKSLTGGGKPLLEGK